MDGINEVPWNEISGTTEKLISWHKLGRGYKSRRIFHAAMLSESGYRVRTLCHVIGQSEIVVPREFRHVLYDRGYVKKLIQDSAKPFVDAGLTVEEKTTLVNYFSQALEDELEIYDNE